jgi:hypothetical protein
VDEPIVWDAPNDHYPSTRLDISIGIDVARDYLVFEGSRVCTFRQAKRPPKVLGPEAGELGLVSQEQEAMDPLREFVDPSQEDIACEQPCSIG